MEAFGKLAFKVVYVIKPAAMRLEFSKFEEKA